MKVDENLVAIHEAAHATLCAVYGRDTIKATIVPEQVVIDGETYTYHGRVTFEGPSIGARKNAHVLFAGAFAEAMHTPGHVSVGAGEDVKNIKVACAFYGFKFTEVAEEAATLVNEHYDAIQKVAAALIAKGTVETDEIYGALK